jgi:HK97 gp10 family phage protein
MATQRAGLELDLSGLKALASLTQARGVTLKGVRAGGKIVQAAAKARAPKRSGALRQSIGLKAQKGNKGKTVALAVIGARKKVQKMVRPPRGTKKILAIPAKYAHLVEKGTKPRTGHPGAKANPFLRPAFDATKSRAVQEASRVIAEEIQKVIAKQAAKLAGGKK